MPNREAAQFTVQSAKRIFLMRHGHTFDSHPDAPILQRDAQLTQRGHDQAGETAAFLHSHVQFDALFTSELQRTIDTIAPLAALQNRTSTPLPGLNELEFNLPEGSTFRDLYRVFGETRRALKNKPLSEIVMGNGRTMAEIYAGYLAAWQTIVDAQGEHILVVAHGGTNSLLISTLLGMPLHRYLRFYQDNCAINIIEAIPPSHFAFKMINYTVWDPLKTTFPLRKS